MMWRDTRLRRAVWAVSAAATLTVALAACGGGGTDNGKGKQGAASTSVTSAPASQAPAGDGTPSPTATRTLGTLQGTNGLELVIQSAVRDQGGFLTLSGVIKNTSSSTQLAPIQWAGDETQVKEKGLSLAGMTLVDPKGKKRYYVLRDTDGYPLTTMGDFNFSAGQTQPFFAQFPAPPASTTQVGVDLPTMNTATIAIS
ncbi:hypothetical protein [Streptomyces sp. NRRL F-5126]|uniref:hypothetical protein n=1 Tax=Streptomyces sp. NRRL F-5126 TaxID=1463857 RepID=UPI0004CB7049|nr:hypothetical protein [Streptomyces sp. NRRL F-5126]